MRIFIVSLLIITFNLIYSPGAFADYPDNSIIINIPSRTLDLYIGGVLRKSYPVGVGRPGFPTPIGHFKVENKVRNPGWEHPYKGKGAVRISPGGRSPLGTRWIAFKIDDGKNEYGIHGTYNSSSVGKFSSHGCIRMHIKDVEDLYYFAKHGMPVIVTYETSREVRDEDGSIITKTYPDRYKRGKEDYQKVLTSIKTY